MRKKIEKKYICRGVPGVRPYNPRGFVTDILYMRYTRAEDTKAQDTRALLS